jgi:DNA-binding response OmpR family regulator
VRSLTLRLTSLDSVEDKLTGFDCVADDYVVKSFSFQGLFARIKALIRRNKESVVAPVLKVLDLELDYQNRRQDYLEAFWKLVNWAMIEKRYNEFSGKTV